MVDKHIVTFGGLSPSRGKTHPLISYVLSLSDKECPKVCFIPTATGDAAASIVAFYDRFPASDAQRSHLALFNRTIYNIEEYLLPLHFFSAPMLRFTDVTGEPYGQSPIFTSKPAITSPSNTA